MHWRISIVGVLALFVAVSCNQQPVGPLSPVSGDQPLLDQGGCLQMATATSLFSLLLVRFPSTAVARTSLATLMAGDRVTFLARRITATLS